MTWSALRIRRRSLSFQESVAVWRSEQPNTLKLALLDRVRSSSLSSPSRSTSKLTKTWIWFMLFALRSATGIGLASGGPTFRVGERDLDSSVRDLLLSNDRLDEVPNLRASAPSP